MCSFSRGLRRLEHISKKKVRKKEMRSAERKFEAHQEQLRLERIERSEEREHAMEMHIQMMQFVMEVVKNSQNVSDQKGNEKQLK